MTVRSRDNQSSYVRNRGRDPPFKIFYLLVGGMSETKLENSAAEWYRPSPKVIAHATIPDWLATVRMADADFVGFWEAARRNWSTGMSPGRRSSTIRRSPSTSGSSARKTNIVHNALDRHLKTHRRNKLALIWEGENGEQRTFSYHALNREVSKFANVLKAHGRQEGRPGHHLHGPRPRAADRHAGLRQDRRRPLGGLRRLLGRGAARPHRGLAVAGGHHRRRRLHERQDRRAEGDRRRGPQARRRPSST